MREKGQTEVAKTLETPVFSRGIEILTEKIEFVHEREHPFRSCEEQLLCILDSLRTKIVEKRIKNLIGPEKYVASAKICIKEARI